ncbi:MAG TPA: hypothetical protein VGI40_14285 [Pirellulaceae bacterium]|jgi:hypothetical protein
MSHNSIWAAAIVTALSATACQRAPAPVPPDILEKRRLSEDVRHVLDNADRLELFSIGVPRAGAPALPTESFQTCTLLGKALIIDAPERKELLAALYKGIEESNGPANCFEPGFGLRATTNGETAELLICFECLQINVTFHGEARKLYTSDSPLEKFNAALTRAGVALP